MFSTCALCIVGGILNYYSLRRWLVGDDFPFFISFVRSFVRSFLNLFFISFASMTLAYENEFVVRFAFTHIPKMAVAYRTIEILSFGEKAKHFALIVFTCCFVTCQSTAFLSPYFLTLDIQTECTFEIINTFFLLFKSEFTESTSVLESISHIDYYGREFQS